MAHCVLYVKSAITDNLEWHLEVTPAAGNHSRAYKAKAANAMRQEMTSSQTAMVVMRTDYTYWLCILC